MYFRTAFGPGLPRVMRRRSTARIPIRCARAACTTSSNILDSLVPDDTWWTQHIIVEGNHIQIFVNDKKTVDFMDEKNTFTDGLSGAAAAQRGQRRRVQEPDV